MKWTKEQLQAIETEGTNILVSAGAGSGKTTVLTERLVRKTQKGRLKRLLVLTFTNAAASEMRDKIRKKIMENSNNVQQLEDLDGAYFTTFDSFAQSMVRKYADVLNLSPMFQIDSQKITSIERKQIIEHLFEQGYEEQNPAFLEFIKSYAIRDDKLLVDMMLKLSFQMDKNIDPKNFLSHYFDDAFKEERIEELVDEFVLLGRERIRQFQQHLENNMGHYEAGYLEKVQAAFSPLFAAKTLDEITSSFVGFPKIYSKASEETKKYHKWMKDYYAKKIKSLLEGKTRDNLAREYRLTEKSVLLVTGMLHQISEKLGQYKKEHQIFEFDDIARFAYVLVRDHPEIAKEIGDSFDEILVDEYQDTNSIQDQFLKFISHNNLYMVGDIKQSIYRFRNAEPSIFQDKFVAYGQERGGIKVDLLDNFRSRTEVIKHINDLFRNAMVGGPTEINYQQGHEMKFGNQKYVTEGAVPHRTGLEVHTYEWETKNPPLLGNQPMKREELELFYIGNQIKQKVQMQMPIFDGEKLRKAEYSDFTILIDRTDKFSLLKDIFDALQVPVVVEKDEEITNSLLPLIIKNLMVFLHHSNDLGSQPFLYAFTSIARSFLYRLSDEEILRHIMDPNTIANSPMYQDLFPLFSTYAVLPLDQLMKQIFEATHFYEKLIEIGDVMKHRTSLDYLLQVGSSMAKLGYDSIAFVEHIERLFKYQEKITFPNRSSTVPGVRLMTIHKSKGLEFNWVYYPILFKYYNYADLKEHFAFDEDYGFVFSFIENGGYGRHFIHTLMKERQLRKERAEKLRLLYVALTRAKEGMVVVFPRQEGLPRTVDTHDCFAHIFQSLEPLWTSLEHPFSHKNVDFIPHYDRVETRLRPTITEGHPLQVFSVDVNTRPIAQQHASKSMQHLKDDKEEKILQLGTALHYALEVLDFKNPNYDLINDETAKKVVERFLKSPLMLGVQGAHIYKEMAFVTQLGGKEYRGIIDLVVSFKDKIYIIDYKTSAIDDPEYDRQLSIYFHFLSSKFDLPIEMYLYSLFQGHYRRVEPIEIELEPALA